MEQLTIKTPKGAALKMDDTYPDETTAREDLMRRYRIAIDRLAAYEGTGLMPEEITTGRPVCVFYCNRQCNLDGDFCPEGPGCPMELDQDGAKRLLALRQDPPITPLTLEELREMDGESVWVERPGYGKKWALVQVLAKSTNVIYFTYNNGSTSLAQVELDCGGKAYRQKPEEE